VIPHLLKACQADWKWITVEKSQITPVIGILKDTRLPERLEQQKHKG
jgi:type III secretory pathway lipoprotein EscJ